MQGRVFLLYHLFFCLDNKLDFMYFEKVFYYIRIHAEMRTRLQLDFFHLFIYLLIIIKMLKAIKYIISHTIKIWCAVWAHWTLIFTYWNWRDITSEYAFSSVRSFLKSYLVVDWEIPFCQKPVVLWMTFQTISILRCVAPLFQAQKKIQGLYISLMVKTNVLFKCYSCSAINRQKYNF